MELVIPSFERQKKVLQELGFHTTAKMVLGLPQIEINRQADEHERMDKNRSERCPNGTPLRLAQKRDHFVNREK